MKPRKNASIDGFVTRRQNAPVDEFANRRTTMQATNEESHRPIARADLAESLRSIDADTEPEINARPKRRFRLFGHKRGRAKDRTKIRKRIVLLIIALVIIVGGFFLWRAVSAMLKLTHGNLISLVTPGTPLKTDGQGRTNILVLGTSQDDAAHQDAEGGGGMWLTDSIMLVSLNQKTHAVKTVSIPRDLWVKMPGHNCSVGYQAKINAVYECGGDFVDSDASAQHDSDYAAKDKKGAQALESTVKDVTGLTPQYYAHVNYTVLRQAVDAVGGVKVDIQGDGADGIYDTNFDWDCSPGKPYSCKNVYYPHDGEYTLNGKQALFLARARGDAGLYSYKNFGLDRGDFDRQLNQQKILQALKDKATSAGTLTNPVALTNLLNALGDNITTDLEAGNYRTLIDFAKKIPKKDGMQSIDLNSSKDPVVENRNIGGQSAVVATSGVLDYTSIISYLAKQLSSNPAAQEDASVAIYNASGTAGAASKLSDKLSAGGINVVSTGNADSSAAGTSSYTIYDTTDGQKPNTINYLKSQLSGAQVSTDAVPTQLAGAADIIIVINQASTSSTN